MTIKLTLGNRSAAAASCIEPFVYPGDPEATSPWNDWEQESEADDIEAAEPEVDLLAHAEEEKQNAFAAGREQGIEEGRRLERTARAAEEADRNARLKRALDEFTAAREETVQTFEPAVVRLALAIAARILRREAHTDPLLLSGAVRVALGQLAASAQVRLRVPAGEAQLWVEWAALLPNMRSRLLVESAEGMRLGDCVIETDLGSADLGVRAQLGEIDRAFFEAGSEAKSS